MSMVLTQLSYYGIQKIYGNFFCNKKSWKYYLIAYKLSVTTTHPYTCGGDIIDIISPTLFSIDIISTYILEIWYYLQMSIDIISHWVLILSPLHYQVLILSLHIEYWYFLPLISIISPTLLSTDIISPYTIWYYLPIHYLILSPHTLLILSPIHYFISSPHILLMLSPLHYWYYNLPYTIEYWYYLPYTIKYWYYLSILSIDIFSH